MSEVELGMLIIAMGLSYLFGIIHGVSVVIKKIAMDIDGWLSFIQKMKRDEASAMKANHTHELFIEHADGMFFAYDKESSAFLTQSPTLEGIVANMHSVTKEDEFTIKMYTNDQEVISQMQESVDETAAETNIVGGNVMRVNNSNG